MQVDSFHRLLTPAGQRLLALADAAYDELDPAAAQTPLAVGSRLRREHDPDLVAASLTQVRLRRRAVAKFGEDAGRLYFTSEALEQATPRAVAEHRARRVAAHRPGASAVDLGCGIGSDLLALARAGVEVTGVEHDPVRAAVARANLAALGLPGRVLDGRAEEVDRADFDVSFVDPARRDGRGRVFDPAAYSPPWSFVEQVLTGTGCAKVSPAIPHRRVPAGVEAEWVSDRGEVKEAALWSGDLATAGRRATVMPAGTTLTSDAGVAAVTGPVGAVLYEPDGAVVRAGLVAELGARLGATLVDPRIAYLSSDRAVPTPLARCFAVVERLPFREKPLRAALRARDVGPLTIKKRGVEVTPEVLRRRLGLRGTRPATLVLTRVRGDAVALLVEPLPR